LIGSDGSQAPDQKKAAHDLEMAETQLNQVRATAETSRERLATIRETVLREKLGTDYLGQTLSELQVVLGPKEARPAELDRLEKTEASNRAQLTAVAKQVATLKTNAPDLEAADAAARRATSVVANFEAKVTRLDQEISELTGSIRARSEDAIEEALAETRDRLTTAEARLEALETEIAVLSRLKKALGDAQAAARDQYFGPVMAELRPLLALLLDEAKITFNDDTLLPRSLERNGQDEDVSVLSGGMREQLTVLTRLAFARLLAKNGRPVPVILDDALVYSDDDRIERMFDALHRQARDLQIIVFSCRQRAFAQLGGQGLHMVNWTPKQAE
jgi:DNA repair exonuclease SbcCD ATPase subunit